MANTSVTETNLSTTDYVTASVLVKVEPDAFSNEIFLQENVDSEAYRYEKANVTYYNDDDLCGMMGNVKPEMCKFDTQNEEFSPGRLRNSSRCKKATGNVPNFVCVKRELNEDKLLFHTEKTINNVDEIYLTSETIIKDERIDEHLQNGNVNGVNSIKQLSKEWERMPKEKQFSCDKCGKAFPKRGKLNDHMWIHSTVRQFECSICQKRFKKNSGLREHLHTHSEGKQHSCNTCGRAFKHRKSLRIHQSIHTGEKTFECATCGKCFLRRHHFRVHCESHSGEKRHKCNVCEKSFAYKNSLVQHSFTHRKEKPFKCDQCEKRFTQRYHLHEHIATHLGLRVFECYICSKRFAAKVSLKNHILGHIGEKRFQCDVCQKEFVHKSYLNKHMLSHSEKKNLNARSVRRSIA